jgi:aquaporin Z
VPPSQASGPAATTVLVEVVLTAGLVSVVLVTASGARNIGANVAVAVGGCIIVAGLWAAPISGASMNPARSLGPGPCRRSLG